MSSPPNSRCAPNPFRTERASALIAVLVLAAVVALFATHILKRSLQEGKLATRSYYLSVAQNLAEGGLEDALFAANNTYFNSTYGWSTATDGTTAKVKTTTGLALAQGTGEIYIRVDNSTTPTPTVTALGVVRLINQPAVVKQLRMAIVKRSLWANGMVAKGAITFSGNAAVDSYDSSVGVYNSGTNRTDQATIASTSTALDPIDLSSNANIYGYAATAGADPVVSANGRIYGATSPANPKVDPTRVRKDFATNLPDATAPPGTPISLGSISSGTTLPRALDLPGADGRYLYTATSISLAGNNTVSIAGPVDLIVTGTMTVAGNGAVSLSGVALLNASLGLYVAGDISFGGNGLVTGTNKPASVTIYGTAPSTSTQSITISGNGEFIGTIYAPNATLALSGDGANSGAVIAKSITLGGNGEFHYDTALATTATTASTDQYFRPDTWIELTKKAGTGAALARDNRQPFNTEL